MKPFENILFPVDFSPRCENTVPYVKEMVQRCHARLTLIHVVEMPLSFYGGMQPDVAVAWDAFDDLVEAERKRLSDFGCRHFQDLLKTTSVRTVCDRGDPGHAILAEAANSGVDLIMMPTHGHGPFRSFLLGSCTARVLHRAACAVWTGAHLENEVHATHSHIQKVVCAVDLERASSHVIESAIQVADVTGAEIRLVHCVPVPETGPTEDFTSEFDRFLADSARTRLAAIQEEAATNFEVCLEGGNISKVVRDVALRKNADLIVIGRGHVQTPFGKLRSNAYAIIRDAPCPVLSV